MSTLPAPTRLCPVCRAPAVITTAIKTLPCGHYAFLTQGGIVVGWVDTVACALNLERVLNSWEAAGYTPDTARQGTQAIEARYPVAGAELPLEERMTTDDKTLRTVLQERAARQAGITINR